MTHGLMKVIHRNIVSIIRPGEVYILMCPPCAIFLTLLAIRVLCNIEHRVVCRTRGCLGMSCHGGVETQERVKYCRTVARHGHHHLLYTVTQSSHHLTIVYIVRRAAVISNIEEDICVGGELCQVCSCNPYILCTRLGLYKYLIHPSIQPVLYCFSISISYILLSSQYSTHWAGLW